MPKITFLTDDTLSANSVIVEVPTGTTILDTALLHGIDIEHNCEKSCECTTCHVVVREGFDSLAIASEDEENMLDKAWGLEITSRLSCQAQVGNEDLVICIPRTTINH